MIETFYLVIEKLRYRRHTARRVSRSYRTIRYVRYFFPITVLLAVPDLETRVRSQWDRHRTVCRESS